MVPNNTPFRILGIAFLCSSTVAVAQDTFGYAVVYTAKVRPNPTASIQDLENIARKFGSKEVLVFPADGSPCMPTRRVLERFGDPVFAYPGFSVRPQALLDEQTKAGNVADGGGGRTARTSIEIAGNRTDIVWTFPEGADAPVTVSYTVSGSEIIRVMVHPLQGAPDPLTRPHIIRVTGLDGRGDIIQVFEYFDTRPTLESEAGEFAVPARLPQRAPEEQPESGATDLDSLELDSASAAVVCDGADFGYPTRGWPGVHFDTGWIPGGSLCSSALQGRVYANAGVSISGHVQCDFCLDPSLQRLCADSGSGYKEFDVGADAGLDGSLCVNLPWPLPDINWQFTVTGFDLRVYDRASFSSCLLDSCAVASDTATYSICALPSIPIPGLSGNACIDASLVGRCEMCGQSISVSDGNSFTSEHECRTVGVSCTGYHNTASYNESATWTVAADFRPCIYFEISGFRWDWCPSLIRFDIVSGSKPDLAFSSSGLDFNVDHCGNGRCDCGETGSTCCQDCGCPDDGNACTNDVCVTNVCTHPSKPNGTACGDPSNTDCTNPDTCQSGVCQPNHDPSGTSCTSDNNDCTNDVCSAGVCTHPKRSDCIVWGELRLCVHGPALEVAPDCLQFDYNGDDHVDLADVSEFLLNLGLP
jgi:hypothetical protein